LASSINNTPFEQANFAAAPSQICLPSLSCQKRKYFLGSPLSSPYFYILFPFLLFINLWQAFLEHSLQSGMFHFAPKALACPMKKPVFQDSF
jgi:hypothetical protein